MLRDHEPRVHPVAQLPIRLQADDRAVDHDEQEQRKLDFVSGGEDGEPPSSLEPRHGVVRGGEPQPLEVAFVPGRHLLLVGVKRREVGPDEDVSEDASPTWSRLRGRCVLRHRPRVTVTHLGRRFHPYIP